MSAKTWTVRRNGDGVLTLVINGREVEPGSKTGATVGELAATLHVFGAASYELGFEAGQAAARAATPALPELPAVPFPPRRIVRTVERDDGNRIARIVETVEAAP